MFPAEGAIRMMRMHQAGGEEAAKLEARSR
jgi:hypothetical protein